VAGELGFSPEEPHIEEVSRAARVHNERHAGEREASKDRQDAHRHDKRHPKEYLHTLSKAAEASNKRLELAGAPYRFCVCEEGGRVLIDLVTLDQSGNVVKEVKRNITDEDFEKVIEDISALEGLFFDGTG
jgi:hypothetical protein